MATLTISITDEMKEYVEAQIGDEFADSSDYLADLIRRDQEMRMEELRRIVAEARASGISERSLDDIFQDAVERVRAKGTLRA